ncbi:protein BRAWNIN isoform X2 [Leopardus geoffroyi]|uniref:protein BRAWNIN isoform X2 n=1 Tax=Leopardus geoffroyi TaxID=46844 RepID=UPI001E25E52A|nr:protein BRAWNIN isoform X2 [Leopardus geoffroyi]
MERKKRKEKEKRKNRKEKKRETKNRQRLRPKVPTLPGHVPARPTFWSDAAPRPCTFGSARRLSATTPAHFRPWWDSLRKVGHFAPTDHARGRVLGHLLENVRRQPPGHVRRGRSGAQVLPAGPDNT